MNNSFLLIPIPSPLKPKSRVFDLKERLDWGKPALTIIDIRDRKAFNNSRIVGAISMPLEELVERALSSLKLTRDLYIYGSTNEETAEAAVRLRGAGYQNVSELIGGLAAWKAVGYPIDGNSAIIA
jgi:rhodanese-related sulfurtransferase